MGYQTVDADGARLWVVAGAPGAGKSTVAAALADLLTARGQAPAVLDKDVLFGGLVAELLAAAGRPDHEREGVWYDDHVKVHEYAALTAAAAQSRRHGGSALVVAPFTQAAREATAWRRLVDAAGGEPATLVWVGCRPDVLRERLRGRGRAHDAGKLGDWPAFVARTRPDVPPDLPHLVVRTDPGSGSVGDQLERQLSPSRTA